jgi:hypothetical protein
MLFLLSTFGSKGTKEADPACGYSRHFAKTKKDIENARIWICVSSIFSLLGGSVE